MNRISHGQLLTILRYDSDTGIFTYLVNRGRSRKAGDVAGRIMTRARDMGGGYRVIDIDGREYAAHQLAWFYVHSRWPIEQIDHINLERDDNRIANLREATRSQNCHNRRAQANNTSGFKGVSYHKGASKWRATIQRKHLGLFVSREEAYAVYRRVAQEVFGEFART